MDYSHNYRKRKKPVHGLVVHSMGEYVNGTYAPHFLEDIGLSCHYFITPNGRLLETLSENKVAFHAGVSEWNGETNLNETFLGVELLIEGDHDWKSHIEAMKDPKSFTDAHYQALVDLTCDLRKQFDIPFKNIVRHSDVSGPEVRRDFKRDVGEAFDWERFIRLVKQKEAGTI